MPTTAEIRERAEQVTSRLRAFTNQSMQQVRTFASRGADYVQHKLIAFNDTCHGRKNEAGANNWSTTSERNSRQSDSSKEIAEKRKFGRSFLAVRMREIFLFLAAITRRKDNLQTRFLTFHVDYGSRVLPNVTNKKLFITSSSRSFLHLVGGHGSEQWHN